VLLMVVPQERLDSAVPLLAGNFTGLRIFRRGVTSCLERRSQAQACGGAERSCQRRDGGHVQLTLAQAKTLRRQMELSGEAISKQS
jgi:hypothetical protein